MACLVGKWLVCTLSHEGMDGFLPNLHNNIFVNEKELIRFCDHDSYFQDHKRGLRLLENGLSAPYLQNEWMDFDLTCTSILL